MIKRIIDYISLIVLFSFILEMTTILFQVFINPDLRFSIGESNRFVSGLEFMLGWAAIGWVFGRILDKK